jgi:membrane protease YdiL (CAAX protease family)
MMHEYQVGQTARHPDADQPRAPWTVLDMLKGIGIVIATLLVVSITAALVGLAIAGDADEIEDNATALTIVLAASIPFEIALGLVAYHFSVRKYRLTLADLGFRRPDNGWDHGTTMGIVLWGLFSLGLCFCGLLLMVLYFTALSGVGVDPDVDLPDEVFENSGPIIAIGVLSVAFAPVMEETFFRGFIFGGLRRAWGLILAALASGLLFGLAHVGNPGAIYVVPPITIIGAIFAWGYAFSGSLYPAIAAHFVFNLISFGAQLASS